jgi:hypothetical protein
MYQQIRAAIGKMVDSGTHINVAEATEIIAKKLGLSEAMVQFAHIEIRNSVFEPEYKKIPYKQRILFLPHCARNIKNCRAKQTDEGLKCGHCKSCDIDKAVKLAEDLGYMKVFVVPGGSMVKKLLQKYKPKTSIGVCCFNEALMAFDMIKGSGVVPQVVLLLNDGCKDTKINMPLLEERIRLKE